MIMRAINMNSRTCYLLAFLVAVSKVQAAPVIPILAAEAAIAAPFVGYNIGRERRNIRQERVEDANFDRAEYALGAQQKWYTDRIAMMQNAQGVKMRNYANAQNAALGNQQQMLYQMEQELQRYRQQEQEKQQQQQQHQNHEGYDDPSVTNTNNNNQNSNQNGHHSNNNQNQKDPLVLFYANDDKCGAREISSLTPSYLNDQAVPLRLAAGSIKLENIPKDTGFSFFTDEDTLVTIRSKKDIKDITICDLNRDLNDDPAISIKVYVGGRGNTDKPASTSSQHPSTPSNPTSPPPSAAAPVYPNPPQSSNDDKKSEQSRGGRNHANGPSHNDQKHESHDDKGKHETSSYDTILVDNPVQQPIQRKL